jgi:hypothetical protein
MPAQAGVQQQRQQAGAVAGGGTGAALTLEGLHGVCSAPFAGRRLYGGGELPDLGGIAEADSFAARILPFRHGGRATGGGAPVGMDYGTMEQSGATAPNHRRKRNLVTPCASMGWNCAAEAE